MDATRDVVLVVEDDVLIRMDAADTIASWGFEVIEAANAGDAILRLEDRRDVRIVFTDIEMPGPMNGIALAHEVRKRWPNVTIIVVSGRVAPAAGELPDRVPFLGKPYQPNDLMHALGRMA
ncbi:MAG: response regulator [Parvibaculaceae bacterium]